MKILVTGATGFVGSYFIEHALNAGHKVVAVRRNENSQPKLDWSNKVQWLTKGLPDISVEDLSACDVLVHFAAAGVTPQPATWADCFEVNVNQAIDLCLRANESGIARIVTAGTYAEYGTSGLRYDLIPVDAPLEPTDPYSASKAAFSIAFRALCKEQKIEGFYGRLFSAFGEHQYEKNFWPALKAAALAGKDFPMTQGEQVRDFIDVHSVADIYLSACAQIKIDSASTLVRNVASGEPVTLARFAQRWWDEWGATGKLLLGDLPYREGEVMSYIPEV